MSSEGSLRSAARHVGTGDIRISQDLPTDRTVLSPFRRMTASKSQECSCLDCGGQMWILPNATEAINDDDVIITVALDIRGGS